MAARAAGADRAGLIPGALPAAPQAGGAHGSRSLNRSPRDLIASQRVAAVAQAARSTLSAARAPAAVAAGIERLRTAGATGRLLEGRGWRC